MPSFKLTRKIGSGSFGEIYAAQDEEMRNFAVKFERHDTHHPQLFSEYKLYQVLQGGKGIPQVYHFTVIGEYNVMVMELLGHSLEELFSRCGRKFSLKTTLLLGVHILRRLEYFHSKMFVHRDIKPDNFVMGFGENAMNLYIIDYGLAKRYRNPKTNEHIPLVKHSSLFGTARYASVNALQGFEQSRRDDLESIFYVLIYFVKGSLPWQGVVEGDRMKKLRAIADIKQTISAKKLCQNLPNEFVDIHQYIRNLKFDQTPDYSFIRSKLRVIFSREGFIDDGAYDWLSMKKRITSPNTHRTPKRKLVKEHSPALGELCTKTSNKSEYSDQIRTGNRAETKPNQRDDTHNYPLPQNTPKRVNKQNKATNSDLCFGEDPFAKSLHKSFNSTPTLNNLPLENEDANLEFQRVLQENCMKFGLFTIEYDYDKFLLLALSKKDESKHRKPLPIPTAKTPQTSFFPSSSFVSQFSPELKLVHGLSCADETSIRVSIGNSPQREKLKPLKGRQRQRTESFSGPSSISKQ